MIRVYRVVRAEFARTAFDGEGAYLYGGRWSSVGMRLCYTSEHQSLAMLEYFVHLDPDDAPHDLRLATADIPDDLSRESLEVAALPSNWRETPAPPDLARFGDEFVRKANGAVLIVPSALAPSESNWLINPQHPEFGRILVHGVEPLDYDPRLLEKQGRMRHRRR